MNSKYNFNLTLDECMRILDNIKGLVVVDSEGRIRFLSEDMISRINKLGINTNEMILDRVDIDSVHPSSKIKDTLYSQEETIAVYVYNGNPNVSKIKPLIEDGTLVGAIDYDILFGYDDFKAFLEKTDKLLINLDDMREDYLKGNGRRKNKYVISDIKGKSDAIIKVKQKIYSVAETDSTVLILGETGSGKELVAQSIHYLSRRAKNPFVEVNCAAIPENLVESELFGYEEGSFTGAIKGGKAGKFEMANKGTIFLDEIDQLAYHLQPKLLRVLQEREISKVGGKNMAVDVRVIAATNKNLKEMVDKGLFREDLYYRLNVIDIEIPPLRERKTDIPIIAQDYLNTIKNMGYKNITGISDEAMTLLMNYSWPGNIRELFNVIEKGVNMSRGSKLELHDFEKFVECSAQEAVAVGVSLDSTLEEITSTTEREAIIKMLELCNNNRTKAAKNLKITRQCLHKKMNKYGIK